MRTIDFDYDDAVRKATRLFWRDGYVGTSLRNLLKVMGIGEGSFYNTIKSKKRLYLECLKRYEETEGYKRRQALASAPTARLGIRAMFKAVLDCLDDPRAPSRLCMMAAMVSGEVLSDPDLRKVVEDGMASIESQIAERLKHDRKAGALPADLDALAVASVITTYGQGLWRKAMLDYDRGHFERQIDIFLAGLGL